MSCYWIFYCLYWILENLVGKSVLYLHGFYSCILSWRRTKTTDGKNRPRVNRIRECWKCIKYDTARTLNIHNGKWVRPIFSLTFKQDFSHFHRSCCAWAAIPSEVISNRLENRTIFGPFHKSPHFRRNSHAFQPNDVINFLFHSFKLCISIWHFRRHNPLACAAFIHWKIVTMEHTSISPSHVGALCFELLNETKAA